MSSSLGIFKHSLLKYLQFPSRNYLFYIGDRPASISHTRLRLNFSALKYHLFQKNCCPVLFATHLLKTLNVNIIFCTAQVLLLCLKSCLPTLHIYLETDSIVLPIKKKLINFYVVFLTMILILMLCFFSVCPIIYFLVNPFLLTSISPCMFCSIVTCEGTFLFYIIMHC